MPAILDRMPAGFAGEVSRKSGAVIETVIVGPAAVPFGAPVQLDAQGRAVAVFDAAKPVYGFMVRVYPSQAFTLEENSAKGGSARPGTAADVLRSGYMTVALSAAEGTKPAKGTPVKVVFADSGAFKAGDIAASQGTAVPACTFMGEADANGVTEIAFNI